jgi:hypothetical protein
VKLRTLDRARPYGEIHGGARLRYDQDGITFDERGREIRDGVVAAPEDDESTVPADAVVVNYRSLPVVQLKQLVENFGQTYKNKAQALDFLEGRAAAVED